MRFMILVIPDGYSTAKPDAMPTAEIVERMMKYNTAMKEAGILLSLDGLHPPSAATRITFAADGPKLANGPFHEVKETLGGYWMIRVASKEEAIEWAMKFPLRDNTTLEVRQVQEFEEFPADVQEKAADFQKKQSQ